MNVTELEKILPYANGTVQTQMIEALIEHGGSLVDAMEGTTWQKTHLCRAVRTVKARAAKYDFKSYHNKEGVTPDGFSIKGTSTLYDNEGNPKIQWVKTTVDSEKQMQGIKDYIEGLCVEIPQATPAPASREKYASDLLPTIFIGDAHIGMRAYGKETKHHDFDTGIATQQLREAVDYLSSKIEPAEQGMIVDVGDYTHSDGHSDTTTAGTPLDVDTRYHSTMLQAAMCMRYMIGKMLEKCKTVTVVVARGNHNDNSSVAIQLMLSFYYEKEPRVNILDTKSYYHYIEYGNWLLGITHGNKQKPEALAGSMARDMAQAWGRTTHRMWCTGHYHKEAVKTLPGVKHKVFAALPPPDSWHSSHGFSGDGEMEMMTFRREGGVHSSHVYNIPRPIVEPDVRL